MGMGAGVGVGVGMDNRRQGTLRFHCEVDSLLHGLAGYFESTLWPESSHSREGSGMHSKGGSREGAGREGRDGSREGSREGRGSRDRDGRDYRDERDGKDRESGSTGAYAVTGAGTDTESDAVMLSTEPRTHTPGMYSWFPLFLPLQTPVRVRKGDIIVFHVWRCCDSRKVWYEWCLGGPVQTVVQNVAGRHYSVGL
jgi:hypothetical protein